MANAFLFSVTVCSIIAIVHIAQCIDTTVSGNVTTTTQAINATTARPVVHRENKTKCYPFVGCFDNFPPFDNAELDLPNSPAAVGTQMQLFTRTNLEKGQFLDFKDLATITHSNFSPARKTKFIIHGFSNSIKTPWIYEMKDELLKLADFNVIVVTWGPGAALPFYEQAVANTRMVGTQMRLIIDLMVHHAGAKLKDIHLIGHSLGAHTSGYTGYLLHGKIGRITGLDAAEPDFEHHPIQIRLDPTDALFVDVIHTNGAPLSSGGAGLMQQSGHVDFYVNGGEVQPDCPSQLSGALSGLFGGGAKGAAEAIACSHSRSHDVFTESINSPCPFTAYPCKNYASFSKGECLDCGTTGCSQMGYYADQYHARGKLYLNTRMKKPFCGFHYVVTIHSGGPKTTYGTINIRLNGEFGSTGWMKYIDDDEIVPNKVYRKMIMSLVEVGDVKSITVQYVKRPRSFTHWFGGESQHELKSVDITSGEIGGNFFFCLNGVTLMDKQEVVTTQAKSRSC